MRIPTHFYLKRRKWTVDIVSEQIAQNDVHCRGICEFETRTILLAGHLGPRKLLQTFCHEFLHACEFEYGIKIAHKAIYQLEAPTAYMVMLMLELYGTTRKKALQG